MAASTPNMPPVGDAPIVGPAVLPSPRWIRVRFGSEIVADSRRALLLRQYGPGRLPTYYFPRDDVRMDLLIPAPATETEARWSLHVNGRVAPGVASMPLSPAPDRAALAGHLIFDWDAMDAWYEEEEEVFVHARDPFHRVDALRSSRHLRIALAGETLAETRHPILLFETSLPTRYYLPPGDVRTELLEQTTTTTRCPHKGQAIYWSAQFGERLVPDIAWSYPEPLPECPKIAGRICFFDERVDVYVDDVLQQRPASPWSGDAAASSS